jgi:arsenate reductase
MNRLAILVMCGALVPNALGAAPASSEGEVGPLVRSLWLVQRYGTNDATDPRNDQRIKGSLSKALGKTNVLTAAGARGLIDPSTFTRLAGPDARLEPAEVTQLVEADVPSSRKNLFSKVAAHADYLTPSFDMIDEPHQAAGEKLADWIVEHYKAGQPLHVTAVCTGNSRRSILTSVSGNIAAAYYGMPEIRFHSGGTAPTAFNPRTITALKEIGVEVEKTGLEAPRGEPLTANPIYKVRWGESVEPALEATEFSKTYFDASNPRKGFAALMVCGEADAGCPVVKGAAFRVSMPYLDPKVYDGSAYEKLKYAERRDDIGRLMLSVMLRVRNRVGRG